MSVLLSLLAAHAIASEPEVPSATPAPEHHEEEAWEPEVMIGVRAVTAWSWRGEEPARFVAGGSLVLGGEVARGKLELEVEAALGFAADGARFFVLEAMAKKPFHVHEVFQPYVVVGPIVSLAFEREDDEEPGAVGVEAGLVAGPGLYVWMHEHLGLSFDVTYRFLVTRQTLKHQVPVSLGLVARF